MGQSKRNPVSVEHRHGTLRRDLNALVRSPDGDFSPSKLMAFAGQGMCLWLIWAHTDAVLNTEYTLLTLLVFLIIPDSAKKLISMKLGVPDVAPKPAGR